MLETISRSKSRKRPARPYSALTSLTHRTEYRLKNNDSLNSIRASIQETFESENRSLKEIRELTGKAGPKY
jgi:methionine aminopeptidase